MKELTTLPIFSTILSHLDEGVLIDRIWDLPKALLLSYLYEHHEGDIVVITSGESGSTLFEDLSFFQSNLLDLPAWETSGSFGERPSKDVMGERLNILKKCESLEKKILFTPVSSFYQKVLSETMAQGSELTFSTGKDFAFDQLVGTLEALGMHKVPIVNDKGEFALRGSIVDLFPSHEKEPYRVEFFGNTIESIRTFDANSQISTGKIDEVSIGISDEFELLQKDEEKRPLFSLFTNPILVFPA